MTINNRGRAGGFTLIEVLLALSLSAVLSSALYGLLWTGASAWKRMRERAELYQTARIVFERLETDLQNQVPLNGGANKELFAFEGTQTHVAFPTVISVVDLSQPSRVRGAIARVSYTWKKADAGQPAQLVREWTVYAPEASGSAARQGSDAFPLDVAGISFAYPVRQPPPAAPPIAWDDHWEEAHKIPEGLRVELALRQPASGEELTLRRIVQIWQGKVHVRPES